METKSQTDELEFQVLYRYLFKCGHVHNNIKTEKHIVAIQLMAIECKKKAFKIFKYGISLKIRSNQYQKSILGFLSLYNYY